MSTMPVVPEPDASLTQLLEVERRLEERLHAAELEARAEVAAAHSALEQAPVEARSAVAAQAAREEQAARAEAGAALAAVEAERAAALKRLQGLPDAEIDRLARLALERAMQEGL